MRHSYNIHYACNTTIFHFLTNTHSHSQSYTHTDTQKHMHVRKNTQTDTHTHKNTHTHTHITKCTQTHAHFAETNVDRFTRRESVLCKLAWSPLPDALFPGCYDSQTPWCHERSRSYHCQAPSTLAVKNLQPALTAETQTRNGFPSILHQCSFLGKS